MEMALLKKKEKAFRPLIALALLIAASSVAGPRENLFRNERVCNTDGTFCFRGSLTYYPNPQLMSLRARVQAAPGPGMLRIRLSGANDLGHLRYAPFEVRVRGRYSEIINHKMIPDHPDVESWEVVRVEFIADEVE